MTDVYPRSLEELALKKVLEHSTGMLSFRHYNALLEMGAGSKQADAIVRRHLHNIGFLRRKIGRERSSNFRDTYIAKMNYELALLFVHLSQEES